MYPPPTMQSLLHGFERHKLIRLKRLPYKMRDEALLCRLYGVTYHSSRDWVPESWPVCVSERAVSQPDSETGRFP
jgi:hypothetical protein